MPDIWHTCPTCGEWKLPAADLCGDCGNEYGTERRAWPDWLIYLVRDQRRERYQSEQISRYEVSLDCDICVEDGEVIEWERLGQRGGAGTEYTEDL